MQLMQRNTEANEQILLDCPGRAVPPATSLHAYLPFCDDEMCNYRPDCRIYVLYCAEVLAGVLPVAVYVHALQACIGKSTESKLHRLRVGSLQAMCVLQWGCCLSNHPYGPAKLRPHVMLGSDITYDSAQFLPLLQTIAAYAVVNHDLQVALLLFLSSSSTCLHHMLDHKSKGTCACLLSYILSTSAVPWHGAAYAVCIAHPSLLRHYVICVRKA